MAHKKEKITKTNALREVEAAGIPHDFITFSCEEAPSGTQVAHLLGEDPNQVFKTLVTQAKSGQHYVFMVPVAHELDLKKAALAAHEKAISMIPAKELLSLTGYVHGGCSPIGMKSAFPTYLDETAQLYDEIYFSGGRIGCQMKMAPSDLQQFIGASFADLIME